jgi:hypothetical protein
MKLLRNTLFSSILLSAAAFAAVDPALLNLVPPDATMISGIQVDQSKTSKFGQYVLSQMSPSDPGLLKFITDTGFDPRRDLNELVVATTGPAGATQMVVFGRGTFNSAKIMTAGVASTGATVVTYNGVYLLTHQDKGTPSSLAFLGSSTAVMGSVDAVKAAIDRNHSGGPYLSSDIQAKIQSLGAANDAWFLSTGPVTNLFGGAMPDKNLSQAMNGNLLQAVISANGGVKFGSQTIVVSGEAVTRSDKDATALADVIRFVAGLVQTNQDGSPQAQQAATLLSGLQLSTSASTMKLSLSLPEATMEQLFMSMPHPKAAHKTTASLNLKK